LKNPIDISFVVIGYNEGKTLRGCLESIREVELNSISYEIIYVDGGSCDDSMVIARNFGVDLLLGGEHRRKAAENRNLGAMHSKGKFIQFLDGDMKVDRAWAAPAYAFINENHNAASACGYIHETGNGFFKRVLEIDWVHKAGEADYCGGAALWRKDIFLKAGGFPEYVSYGEEPCLCWKIRNELGMKIFLLDQQMVTHDLGFSGIGDYWRRSIRCGETYSEIASRFYHSSDRLYLKESISNFLWAGFIMICLVLILTGPHGLRLPIILCIILILMRKSIQIFHRGNDLCVSILYSFHIYFSKLPLALGGLVWLARSFKYGKSA
jgi:glycosyltransferase involved in cell wall biosynthesis